MKTYRISPSLMNAFSDYLNAEELWLKFWGNADSPAKSLDEFTAEKRQNVIDYINRAPQPLNEAADRGICLNEIIDCLIGSTPNSSVVWDKDGSKYWAERNGFHFDFDATLVEELELQFKDAIPQYHLRHVYTPRGVDYAIELHGYADYIFPTMIWDLKTTNKYEGEKYANNWQRLVYPVVAVDAEDMIKCERFVFHAVEMFSNKLTGVLHGRRWNEVYDCNIDDARSKIMEFLTAAFVPQFDKWLHDGLLTNQTILSNGN